MANDRIMMTCRGCKAVTMLAKYYPPIEKGVFAHGVWDKDRLVKFIDDHMVCSRSFGRMSLEADRCFNLWTESDPEHREEFNSLLSRKLG